MKRELTCIICPRGCSLCAAIDRSGITVTGNSCPRGESYAIEECTAPTRTVTSVVRVSNRPHTMVSVKTAKPIPKDKIGELMKSIRAARVEAPVKIGEKIWTNSPFADIITTETID